MKPNFELLEELQKAQSERDLTTNEKKQLERELKRLKDFRNGMITRAEAFELAQQSAEDAVRGLQAFMLSPLRTNMIHSMAVAELLMDKGIVTKDEFQTFIDRVTASVNQKVEGENNGKEESGEESNSGEEKAEE